MTLRNKKNRRTFLVRALGAPSGALAVPYLFSSSAAFANRDKNDRPTVGCVGLGSMGLRDAAEHNQFGDVLAVCDVDSDRAAHAKRDGNIGKGRADVYADYRKLLERNDIEVVSISTPDHWHVKIAIEALQAGKHVFCQKPLTLTLEENQLIRRACKKYPDRVFMVGTQQRSEQKLFLRAVNMVQKGLLGDIRKITVGIDGAPAGGPFPIAEPPKNLDWNAWLGQAPMVPYREARCHSAFRWWYEYSGGKFTDWGAHHVDIATWAIGQDKQGMGPTEIDGTDAEHPMAFAHGYPTVDDCWNTSTDFSVKCRFASGIEMAITSRGDNGILFEGTKGRVFVNRTKITGTPIEENWDDGRFAEADVVRLFKGKPPESHKSNFYRCIREGGETVSDVDSHVQMMNTCHLAGIASRLNRVIHWDSKLETIVGDQEAASFFARDQRTGFEIPRI